MTVEHKIQWELRVVVDFKDGAKEILSRFGSYTVLQADVAIQKKGTISERRKIVVWKVEENRGSSSF